MLSIALGGRCIDRASQIIGTGLVGGQRLGGVVGAHANDGVGAQHLAGLGAGKVRLAHVDAISSHLECAFDVVVHHKGDVVGATDGKHLAGKLATTGVVDVLLAQLHERRSTQDGLFHDVAEPPPVEPARVGHGIDRKAATQGVSICVASARGAGPLR